HEHLVGGQHEYRFFFQAEDGIRDRVLSDDEGRHETRQRVEHAARRFSRELASGKHIDRGRRLRYRAILTPGAGDDHFLELFTRTGGASRRAARLLGQGRWVGRDERRRRRRDEEQAFHSRSPLVVI